MRKIFRMEFYQVKISNRNATVSKEFFKGSNMYRIMFINDKESDYINSYETFGFLVEITSNETTFKLFGKLTNSLAESIWSQMLNPDSLISIKEIDYTNLLRNDKA
jgi:hypothetical protein